MGSTQLTGRVIFKGDPGYTEAIKIGTLMWMSILLSLFLRKIHTM